MAPLIPSAELRLSYPLYAVDFDPQDDTRLVVGGGGGASRTGVGNKISVLDTSNPESLEIVSELELSRDEDSVNTIAVGARQKDSILVYAGINSGEADVKKGKNEHFRVFSAPTKAKAGAIRELSRTSLFKTEDKETYQRVLRISNPTEGSKQVGAAATGTSQDPQIALFDLPTWKDSKAAAPAARGVLEVAKEATDMDILQTSQDSYQLVYCDDYEIHTFNIGGDKPSDEPSNVWTQPHDEATGAPRPTFRSIRYLTSTFVLAVANLPKAGGVVIQGFRLPSSQDNSKESQAGKARLAVSVKLPKTVKRATGMAVRNLSPLTSTEKSQRDTQFVIAVTGQDSSITLYTLSHQALGHLSLITNLHIITTLKEVHPSAISGLAFSCPPSPLPSSEKSSPIKTPSLKLASIGSMGNTLVVHTLPLKKLPADGPNRPDRHVVALESHGPSRSDFYLFCALVVLFIGFLAQGVLEINGLAPPRIGATHWTPTSWQASHVRVGYVPGGGGIVQHVLPTEGILAEYLSEVSQGDHKVVLNADENTEEIKVQSGKEGTVWEKLSAEQKKAWKGRLKSAGHWGEEMGEAVFKGVLFGEIGGIIGGIVREL
ncbi:hypothetical protein QBC35DRAFT_543570 [Podospora australis]|uniref:Guanine nucleotide-exchange factor SEC12 n=1 Tax=Podospora australis TaxID=1536484 RepID=A0AAN7AKH8_9PEZI|nr:hypothetical protein QBC35DRAFT_543570 [Podospora australis]